MITRNTLKPLQWCFQFLSKCRYMPGYWDPITQELKSFREGQDSEIDVTINRILVFLQLFAHTSFIFMISWNTYFTPSVLAEEIIIGIFFICCFIMATAMHLSHFYIYYTNLACHFNSLVQLNEQYGG